ncbi:biotin/lipoyl-binding protein [Algoriphagus aquatilis]|uniref:Biotin/lipoyl-binding protein n=1 Tax=Algoriphagus aquatilis TaxID=490186 RepID=A0ABW0BYX9_9BACT
MRIFNPIVLLISGAMFACSEAKEDSQEIPSESFRNEVAATEVRTATAERKSFDYLINATGKLEALSEVKALVEREGYLEKVQILEGQFVQKGQVIATLDHREAEFARGNLKYDPSHAFVFSQGLWIPYAAELMEKEVVIGDVISVEQ